MTTTNALKLWTVLAATLPTSHAWLSPPPPFAVARHASSSTNTQLAAAVGIFYGTSTGNTQTCADLLYEAFGPDVAAEPVDIDSLAGEVGAVAAALAEHDTLVVGTPTWNTGADTERSGTGWDEIYYAQLPEMHAALRGKAVAVFGLGDQESYGENFADATGELYDVFSGLGCRMLGAWSQEGYEHQDSKAIRGDNFCGLVLDMMNQEDLTEERIQTWVAQLLAEGMLGSSSTTTTSRSTTPAVIDAAIEEPLVATHELLEDEHQDILTTLEEFSDMLNENIAVHSSGGFVPHTNAISGKTLWTSADGRNSFVTSE
jgi:flavodoxin I